MRALEMVTDPEIPVLSVLEMGMVAALRVMDARVEVDVTPTFAGCPAISVIREDIANAIRQAGADDVAVNVVYDPPWTSDRMTGEGRRKLKEFGLAPPGASCGSPGAPGPVLENVACPYCDSRATELESMFGPTLCRSIHYCRNCLQSFEHFKPV